ncbi:hypothetical protein IQ07DRAFT_584668 [Pyrenochaeta sp. DS3sAY3a]|nr:hypothetical protein IQ07DRAFT_584668 [Pyrenochaeta sp. DS3sAY3a]
MPTRNQPLCTPVEKSKQTILDPGYIPITLCLEALNDTDDAVSHFLGSDTLSLSFNRPLQRTRFLSFNVLLSSFHQSLSLGLLLTTLFVSLGR